MSYLVRADGLGKNIRVYYTITTGNCKDTYFVTDFFFLFLKTKVFLVQKYFTKWIINKLGGNFKNYFSFLLQRNKKVDKNFSAIIAAEHEGLTIRAKLLPWKYITHVACRWVCFRNEHVNIMISYAGKFACHNC